MDVPDPASRLRAALGGSGAGSSDYDLNPGIELPEGRRLRPAAVLVALRGDLDDFHLDARIGGTEGIRGHVRLGEGER